MAAMLKNHLEDRVCGPFLEMFALHAFDQIANKVVGLSTILKSCKDRSQLLLLLLENFPQVFLK